MFTTSSMHCIVFFIFESSPLHSFGSSNSKQSFQKSQWLHWDKVTHIKTGVVKFPMLSEISLRSSSHRGLCPYNMLYRLHVYILEMRMFLHMSLSSVWTTHAKSSVKGVEDGNTGKNPNLQFGSTHWDFANFRSNRFHHTIDGKWKKPTNSTLDWHVEDRLLAPCDSQVLKRGQFPHALRDGATQCVVR